MKYNISNLRTVSASSILLAISASPAFAASSYLNTWAGLYPGSTSDNASCQLCHAASTQNLNPYGQAICASNAGSISNRIQAVTGTNSDADPTGADNLTEINANTQPGWTPGNVNPTYSRGTCNATGLVESPPTFIAGNLDPAGGGNTNVPPVANANGPYAGSVNNPVSFSSSGSSDPDGTIVSYSWSFGDGSNSSNANPTHTYTSAGTYNVALTVTDDFGDSGSSSTTVTIAVGNAPPVANANGPYSGTEGNAVAFDGSASNDPDGSIISYSWDFGDGSTGIGATTTHTYSTAGTYNVTLTVLDDSGATDSAGTTATISTAGGGGGGGGLPANHTVNEEGVLHAPGNDTPYSSGCTSCHGADLRGDIGPSCYSCHSQEWSESAPGGGTGGGTGDADDDDDGRYNRDEGYNRDGNRDRRDRRRSRNRSRGDRD